MSKDYYKILGVEKNASTDDIKKAFKKSAMQHHPDRPGGNEAKFKEINEAYQVLSDTEKRQRYDQFGSEFEQQGGFGQGAGANWGGFSGGDFGDFGDIFGEFFGGQGRHTGPARGQDIQVDVEIDFKQAAFGIEKEISLRKQNKCDVCSGSGGEPGSKIDTCSTCKGQGQVTQTQRTFLGAMQTVVACSDCHGSGKKPSKKCKHCGGMGVVNSASTIKVKIPGGIDNGQSIRLDNQGEAAPHGGRNGSLYVRVRVKPLDGFIREGYDVYTEEEISYPQAVLGDKIEVQTLDEKVKLLVPEGVESGQLIRIKGKGIQHLERNSRGDHYVKIKIRVPKKISKEVRKKLEELKNEL
ncbi:MAG: molecular chaperone DnaJ [Candidatus Magasanikbacteria bacterium RIFOXYD2_FULL_39_9]|uniref:Chaperone protein DnaJ n=1 Tax=Candidatus Magasanikbacteria bacterium RIFOXYD1_FULL_40_23 TaxID=1798705 RepID=A0A1F6PAJ8_9BACT|nr:MAG: molecular chaperone DnaJ [Candidatus Magasanikbacteria bacterium RIFOXYD2_FULL_39_9]OGH93192.1 MAG: molecular chaperone DnaJ [Candidatus Magasanikbacteria bacterium RIFOXYD1_FULL_40_23]